jgi:palmitoyltransferase
VPTLSKYGIIFIPRFHVLFLFFVAAMFALSVTSLFTYHLYLVSRNRTTLEAFRTPIFRGGSGPDKLAFHLGIYNNFQEVFGDKVLLWFLPVTSSLGDGIIYPQRGHLSDSDEESGLLSGSGGNGYRDDSSVEELVPMIRSTENPNEDDEDDDEEFDEWSKVDVKDFGGKSSDSNFGGNSDWGREGGAKKKDIVTLDL